MLGSPTTCLKNGAGSGLIEVKTLNVVSVIGKEVSMWYCRHHRTSWRAVISHRGVEDSVQLSNCQRCDREHAGAGRHGYEMSKIYMKSSLPEQWHIKSLSCRASQRVPFFKRKAHPKRCRHLPLIL